MDRRHERRKIVAFMGIVAVALAAVVYSFRPLSASAQNTNPCGTLWSDSSPDAPNTAATQTPKLDIVSGNLSDNSSTSPGSPSLTTTLTISNLSAWAATDGDTANEYYFVWAFNGTSYFTNAESSATGTTYTYGTYDPSTGLFSGVGTAPSGTFNSTPNVITVTVPFSAIGNPIPGSAFLASGIFGQTGQLTGALGSGLVSTSDKDPSTFDYVVGQTCGGATPTPSATATPTTTPTSQCPNTQVPPESNTAQPGWFGPVELCKSGGLGEPSITHDSGAGHPNGTPRLFVIAPQAIGNGTNGGSPLFTSVDGGAHWSPPVQSPFCTIASGGDTDLAVDGNDNLYSTDLWLGNSCVSVSDSPHQGASYDAGSAYGDHVQPGDDRPWIAWDKSAGSSVATGGENFFTYDGLDAVRIANTAPITNPAVGVQAVADNAVVAECLVGGATSPCTNPPAVGVRQCVCPPGGIATDNTTGAHAGRVYVSYSYQTGTAISYADPNAAGITPTTSWHQVLINDGNSGSAFQDEWNFAPVKVDSNGTVYVMWAHALNFANSAADASGVQEYYSFSIDGGVSWHAPILLSTQTGTTTFPTMDVAGPGIIDTAWYGTTATGDPNTVSARTTWNVYYARVSNADLASGPNPSFTPQVAISDMHNGCIQTGGGKACTDRSLLDFFQLTDDPGSPDIIFTVGDATNGVNLYFTKLTNGQNPVATPESPWPALLLLPGLGAAGLALRVRRRKANATI